VSSILGISEEQARAAVPDRGWLKGYVKWGEGCTDANIAYHIIAGLTCLAQTVPIDFGIPFAGDPIRAPIYGLLIGASTAARKTTAVNLARRLVHAAIPERIGVQPGSAEAIIDELAAKPQQIIYIPEYGSILAQAERSYATAMKTQLTNAYDCSPMGRKKANGKGVSVESPRLSVLAGCAPGYVERHTEPIDWTEGYLARHLTVVANRERNFDDPEPNHDLEQRLVTWLKAVSKSDFYSTESPIGPCLGFEPGAAKVRAAWQRKIDAINTDGRNRMIAAALGRVSAMGIKIAGLLCWDWGIARTGMSWQITEEAMVVALRIAQLHVDSVVEIGAWLAPTNLMRDRRTVLSLIKAEPTRRGHIMREAQMTKRDFDNIIGTLLDERTVRLEVVDGETYYALDTTERSVTRPPRPETRPDPSDAPPADEEPSPFTGDETDFSDPTFFD
jgi:hypothetical protein